jgi:hypothetical protein
MKDLLGKFKDLQFYTGETFFYYFTHHIDDLSEGWMISI